MALNQRLVDTRTDKLRPQGLTDRAMIRDIQGGRGRSGVATKNHVLLVPGHEQREVILSFPTTHITLNQAANRS